MLPRTITTPTVESNRSKGPCSSLHGQRDAHDSPAPAGPMEILSADPGYITTRKSRKKRKFECASWCARPSIRGPERGNLRSARGRSPTSIPCTIHTRSRPCAILWSAEIFQHLPAWLARARVKYGQAVFPIAATAGDESSGEFQKVSWASIKCREFWAEKEKINRSA